MKYVIDKNNKDKKLVFYGVNIKGLEVKPINEVKNQKILVGKVVLTDNNLQSSFIKKRVDKKIDKIIKFMLQILNGDASEDDSGIVLDEINRLKGIIINKYRNYMTDQEYKAYLAKLILIEDEFKKSYNEKIFMSFNNNYVEDLYSARGR